MLKNFFTLNPGFKVVATEEEFLEILKHSDALRDLLYEPDTLSPNRPINRIRDKTFSNISFAKTSLVALQFTRCRFVDCLFIGTSFVRCEFHDCSFEGCNLNKVDFTATYVDPACFTKTLDPIKHSNIGTWLFQRLLQNSVATRQTRFAQTAEYQFHKWKRYQLTYEYKKGQLTKCQYYKKYIPSRLYDFLAGYGIRLFPFVRLTLALLAFCVLTNHFAWSLYGMAVPELAATQNMWIVSFYYTISTITTLGLGDYAPTTSIGMLAASVQSILGVLWLSLLASTIIKRVTK